MTVPTFKKATSTAPGDSTMYGAPDVKYAFDVLDGTHATDRIQLSVIEGIDKFAAYAYYVRQSGASTFQAIRQDTGAVQFSGSDFAAVMNSVIGALPFPSSTNPINLIYISGSTLDCTGSPITIDKPCVIDGMHSATVRKAAGYSSPNRSVFRIHSSDVVLKNMVIEDFIKDVQVNRAISIQPSAASFSNILIDRVRMRNFYNGIYLHATTGTAHKIQNVVIRDCWFDNGSAPASPLPQAGPAITVGLGSKSVAVQNCYIIEPGDTAIEVFATDEHIKLLGNYILKQTNTAGSGIDISNYGSSTSVVGAPTNNVVVRDNRILGPLVIDGIRVTGGAEKITIANNFVNGPTNDGISITLKDVGGTDYYAKEVMVLANIIQNISRHAIFLNSAPAIDFQGLNISDNLIRDISGNGIHVNSGLVNGVIARNSIFRYGIDQVSGRTGIRLRNTTFTNVIGNKIIGLTGSTTPTAGASYTSIIELETTNNNTISNNGVNQTMTIVGAATIVSMNNGFKTEASNTVSGSTSPLTVTHGLAYTPQLKEIFVTPTTAWGSMTSFYVNNITSTTFDIVMSPNPGQSVTFAWQATRTY